MPEKQMKEMLNKENENLKLKIRPKRERLKEKGITLIALVVTIIILLILAGVTLNIALSDNGLFKKAKEVAEKYKEAQTNEEELITDLEKELDKYGSGKGDSGTIPEEDEDKVAKTLLKPGDYIKYTPEAKEFKIEKDKILESENDYVYNTGSYTGLWRVLYNDDTHGLQIISAENVTKSEEEIAFLDENFEYFFDLPNLDHTIKFANSIEILNGFSRSFVDERYATSGRCIGTNPEDPDKVEEFQYKETYDDDGNSSDNMQEFYNLSDDYKALTSLDKLYLWKSNESYFLACRFNGTGGNANWDSDWRGKGLFYVSCPSDDESIDICKELDSPSDDFSYNNYSSSGIAMGIRPVITLKTDIMVHGGNGSEGQPYGLVEVLP